MALYNVQGVGKRAPQRRAEGLRGGCRPHLRRRLAGKREDEAAPPEKEKLEPSRPRRPRRPVPLGFGRAT